MKKTPAQPPGNKKETQQVKPRDLLKLPAKKALDVILESPTPVTLVQSLSEEDLFWLVNDIGCEDALPVLAFASNEQWQYLLDLELWNKDRLDITSVNKWLGLLLKADPERFMIWGLREQVDLIELHLFKHISVTIKEDDQSESAFQEEYFTLDGIFYIRVNNEEYYQAVRELIEHLAEHDFNRFQQMLLALAGVLPTEAEESLYRLRNVRLAEKGFLPFEEAIGIYQYLDPNSILENGDKQKKILDVKPLREPVTVSTSLLVEDQGHFYRCLQHFKDANFLERLQMEFAAMCNQIISADCKMVRGRDQLADVVRKACGYLNIALEKLAGGDINKASLLLQDNHVHHLFRVGYGLALKLQWETKAWLKESWFARQAFDLNFWGGNWGDMLEGLTRKRPLFFSAFSEGEPYREFKTLEEVTIVQSALEQIMFIDELLSVLFASRLVIESVEAFHPLTYQNLILTAWARHCLGLSEEIGSLTVEELRTFLKDLWEKGTKPYRVDSQMKKGFSEWLQSRSGQTATRIQGRAEKVLEHFFNELEEEYDSVSIASLDPRYVTHFLVKP